MNAVMSASGKPNIAEELFREALNMYNARPELDPTKNRDLLDEFAQCVSADDIMLALEKRITALNDFRNHRWAKLREKLRPVVEVALLVTKLVGDAAQFGAPGDKGVFAAFGLLLAATQAQSARYATLERLLDRLGAFLSRFKALYGGKSSQLRPGLDQIATTILAHLFYVLVLSTKFIRKGRIKHYLYVLQGFPDDLEEALQKMDNLAMDEHMMMAAQTLVVVEQLPPRVERLDENVQDLQKDFKKVHRVQGDDRLRKWLSAHDPATDRNAALAKQQAGTGDWFLHIEAFKKWRTSDENPVLWLYGQSGSGKTIISASVVDKLLRDTPDLAYFFFVTKSGAKETLDGMLSSLLIQLATLPERHKILCDAYDSDKHIGTPSRSSLLTYFERMLAVPGNVVVVIDALDEHPTPRDELLRFLAKLSRDHHHHLRLLVTSRNEFDIRTAMNRIGAIEVNLGEASEQKKDILKYITSVLESDEPFRTWTDSDPHIIGLIKERLLQERMFRLVALQLDRLRLSTSIDVENTLRTLPNSLMEMYDHILQSMASNNKSAARRVMRVFEIISCASRPLTANEVAEVFAVEFDDNDTFRVLEDHRSKNPAADLLRMCTSTFIRIEEGRWIRGSYVHFAHASVLDYLQREPGTAPVSDFCIDHANSAITLTKLCLCTVLSMIQNSNLERPHGPFDDYAYQFWLQETARALLLKPLNAIKSLLDSILLQDIERIPAQLRNYHSTPSFASPLYCASYLGRHDYVQQILRSSTRTADVMSSNGWTPLHCAASGGHIGCARALIKHGACIDTQNENGQTSLHLALQNGHLDITQVLLEYSASVDKQDKFGQTPLHLALQNGHLDIAQVLIERSACVDKHGKYGETPLHLALQNRHLDIANVLIERSTSVDKGDDNGQTPLHLALRKGYLDTARVLIERSACVDKQGKYGQTPLHLALQKGYLDIANDLIERSTSVDKGDDFSQTPLHLALQNGYLDITQVLIERSASIDKGDDNGQTPLHLALQNGYLDAAQVLVERSASVDKQGKYNQTPLHIALQEGYFDIAQVLIKRGASIDKQGRYGQTPLHLASQKGCLDIARFLIDHSASVDKEDEYGRTPLHLASQNGHLGIVQVLIEHCASVDKEDNYGWTPLHLASQNGRFGTIQVLIEHKAFVDKEGKYGWTPLHFASQNGHLDIAQFLIEQGASINKADEDGQTPLHLASLNGCFGIAHILIDHSAIVDKEDNYGRTSLSLALQNGYLDVVQVLFEHSPSVDKEGKYGNPLHLGSQNLDIVQILIEHVDEESEDSSPRLT